MATYTLPVKGTYKITSPFGWRVDPVNKKKKKHHNADDIVTGRKNEPVLAFANGRVLKARKSTAKGGGFGNYVIIRHLINGKYYTSLYAHLQDKSFKVKPGQLVKAGQQIGIMGATGYVTGVHLHFEIWKGRTHGWSSDGKGFASPVAFVNALIAVNKEKSSIKKTTPAAKPNPIPAHSVSQETATKKAPKTYKVKSGDTLGKIAKANKTTVSTLAKLNKITNVNLIRVGQIIKLP